MAKMTIAQLRERSLNVFNDTYIHDIEKACSLVRSFYRLSGYDNRLLYLENDERFYNTYYTNHLRLLRDALYNVLSDSLKSYGLRITYYGSLPTIENCNQIEALSRYFYR